MRLFSGFIVLILLLISVGCASTPTRHLASDVILIQPGVSTRAEVLIYLGEPDGTRTISPGVDEFVYHEKRKSRLSRIPMLGSFIDDKGYEMVIITFADDIVNELQFRTFNRADYAWVDDFTWQEIK